MEVFEAHIYFTFSSITIITTLLVHSLGYRLRRWFFKVPFVTAAHRGVAWQHGGDAIVVLLSFGSIASKDDSMLAFFGGLDLATLEVVHYINQLGTG